MQGRGTLLWVVALVLPLLGISLKANAAEPQVLARATGEAEPFALTWVDTTDGKLGLDDDFAQTVVDMLGDAQYLFTDQGVLLAKPKDGQLTTILPVLNQVHTQSNRSFFLHVRSLREDNQLIIDGSAYISSQDPTQGFVTLTMHILGKDGELASTYVEQALKVQPNSAPAPQPTPEPTPDARG
jgi:hypothetical protein